MDSISPPWHDILHEAAEAVRTRVQGLLSRRGTMPAVELKRLLDDAAQEALCGTLSRLGASADLVSEEGLETFGRGGTIITADPVDGTTNLARGLSPCAVSISVAEEPRQGAVIAAVVSDLIAGSTYYADRVRGATLDGRPIQTAGHASYRGGLISMDVSKMDDLSAAAPLIAGARHLRFSGCAAMSLCQVAQGVLDAHVDVRGTIRATDVSAGLFILKQASGIYSADGRPWGDFPLRRETRIALVAASGPALLEEIEAVATPRHPSLSS